MSTDRTLASVEDTSEDDLRIKRVSTVITSMGNFSVQFNYQVCLSMTLCCYCIVLLPYPYLFYCTVDNCYCNDNYVS